ncbi:hypothetical protein [Kordiimonas aquimaris]|uniref:hypothetical protein n=1 Tax=Kordiimonas aquimaris TaxID=707591 RepID=UPI0021D2F3FA|nr:hypothetical protein [Kordiimonas aquimaris]
MILESRSIVFSDEELFLALRPVMETNGTNADVPLKNIFARLDSEGEVTAVIQPADGSAEIVFESRELGPAVLNHCIDQGIPLPRGSYKELAIRGDHIALIVRLETGAVQSEIDEDEE